MALSVVVPVYPTTRMYRWALGCATVKCHAERSFPVLWVGSKKSCLAMHRGLHCQRIEVVHDSDDSNNTRHGRITDPKMRTQCISTSRPQTTQ